MSKSRTRAVLDIRRVNFRKALAASKNTEDLMQLMVTQTTFYELARMMIKEKEG